MKNLSSEIEKIQDFATEKASALQSSYGQQSDHSNCTVLKIIGDENQVNLDGSRYLTEIDAEREALFDNKGYEYYYDVISLECLCQILDNQEFQYKS